VAACALGYPDSVAVAARVELAAVRSVGVRPVAPPPAGVRGWGLGSGVRVRVRVNPNPNPLHVSSSPMYVAG